MKVGVLALQGSFAEHTHMLRRMGHEPVEVRLPQHLDGLEALILPGGESTTFGRLATGYGLIEPLRHFIYSGRPVWGTCAGLIFLAKDVGRDQATLGVMDIRVARNAFGRQVDSFVAPLSVKGLTDGPFTGVFIRAPVIESVAPHVEVLCTLADGTIVAARQERMLVTSFHPELTDDPRLHALFLDMRLPATDRAPS
jgi:5'-phosphate synthase pdxT subunit